jgi:hypothetical protein
MDSSGFVVRMNVKKVGHVRLMDNGNDLGDIDVLAVDEYRKTLWVIECKNFGSSEESVGEPGRLG